jgi:hypothetical protein
MSDSLRWRLAAAEGIIDEMKLDLSDLKKELEHAKKQRCNMLDMMAKLSEEVGQLKGENDGND